MLKSFYVDLQHGLQTSRGGFWAYRPRFWAGKDNIFHLVTRPSNFQQFCKENGDTPWAGQEHCSGALFPNLSYFWR